MDVGTARHPCPGVDLLDHGILDAELAGNLPIVVDLDTGECRFMDFDEMLEYRRRGSAI